MCRSKYLSLFVGKFQLMCIQLRAQLHRQVHRQLNSELHRELRQQLYAALYHALHAKLIETLFEKKSASLFGSLFDSKFRSMWASTCLALRRRRPRGRRPPGRSPHDRIVVRAGPHYHIWCMCCWIYAPGIARCGSLVWEKARLRIVTLRRSFVHRPSMVPKSFPVRYLHHFALCILTFAF